VCRRVETLNKQLADKFKIKMPSTPPTDWLVSGTQRAEHRLLSNSHQREGQNQEKSLAKTARDPH